MSGQNWRDLLANHWGKITCGLIGLIFAILVINYGFLITLFVFICVAAGVFIGWRLDRSYGIRGLVERLFPPRDDY